MNKKWIIGAAVLLVLAVGGFAVRGIVAPPAAPPTPTPTTSQAITPLVADGRVVPVRSAALSLPTGGVVARVLVREGERVDAGQLLLVLDQSHERARVANAEAALAEAQASLDRLLAGASEEDIAVAEAQLRQAQAQYQQVSNGVSAADIHAAEAQVSQAQTMLSQLSNLPKDTDRRVLDAQIEQSRQNLALQRDQLSANKTDAELRLQQASSALVQAQTRYSTAWWNWREVERSGLDPINPRVPDPAQPSKTKGNSLNDAQKQQYKDALLVAEADLHRAEQAVQEAQLAVETAQKLEVDGVHAAELQLAQTQASLDRLMVGAGPEEWAAARAQLAGGQANLAKLRGSERASAIAAAHAGVEVAQANLTRLQAPPSEGELVLARTRVQSAKAELDQARLALADTELRAPFAGTVAALDPNQNEFIAPGTPLAQLADLSSWQIETTDLIELSVSQVRAGAPVTITFDALPGVALAGHVMHVKQFGEVKQGDITYTAVVRPDRHDDRLRWNMTATVAIMPGGRD